MTFSPRQQLSWKVTRDPEAKKQNHLLCQLAPSFLFLRVHICDLKLPCLRVVLVVVSTPHNSRWFLCLLVNICGCYSKWKEWMKQFSSSWLLNSLLGVTRMTPWVVICVWSQTPEPFLYHKEPLSYNQERESNDLTFWKWVLMLINTVLKLLHVRQ